MASVFCAEFAKTLYIIEKKMKLIYLDRMMFIDIFNNVSNYRELVEKLKGEGFIFPCSLTHIEEMHSGYLQGKYDGYEEQINFWQELSDGHILIRIDQDEDIKLTTLPFDKARKLVESDDYIKERHVYIESEKERLDFYKSVINSNPTLKNKIRKKIQNRTWDTVFMHEALLSFVESLALFHDFRIRDESYRDIEITVKTLYNGLDLFGFKKEENETRLENRTFDIYHLIYATKCDYFVTNDDKLYNKSKAVLTIMHNNTKILDHDEFIKIASAVKKKAE